MIKNKRKLIVIIIAAILVIAVAAGTTVLLLKNNTKNTSDIPTISQANDTKDKAIEALKNKDLVQAKKLFEEAQKEYKSLGDTNNVVDTEAQLYLIEHTSTTSSTTK